MVKMKPFSSGWPKQTFKYHQGPLCPATADKPEGPWKKYEGNRVLTPGEWGAWDDGGYSEAAVLHQGGLFQVFFSGAKWKKLETTGCAWSEDGIHFRKHTLNPVVLRERVVDCSAMAEIHAFLEYPVFYLFHTARYFPRSDFSYEDIAVQAVAVTTPFGVRMPVAIPSGVAFVRLALENMDGKQAVEGIRVKAVLGAGG